MTNDIQTLTGELSDTEKKVNDDLKMLPLTKTKKDDWQMFVNSLQEKRRKLEEQFHKKENELSKLDIDESDYLQEPAAVIYDPKSLQTISNDLENCQVELRKVDELLQEFKQAVCGITREAITTSWETLVEALINKRDEEVNQYKDITADIIARIKVNEVLRRSADSRAREDRRRAVFQHNLPGLAGNHRSLRPGGKRGWRTLHGGLVWSLPGVRLEYRAHEQVLLGLRIGFAARVLAGTPLFLILDDAFQHSDWERRERLVKILFNLSKEGWQIIYFTMDDHIRSLFESNAKKVGKGQYQTIELPSVK